MTISILYILGSRFPLEIVYKEAESPCLGKEILPLHFTLSQSVSVCLSSLSDISWRLTSRLEGLLDDLVIRPSVCGGPLSS